MTLRNEVEHLLVQANLRPVLVELGERLEADNLTVSGGEGEPYRVVDQSRYDVSPMRIRVPESITVSVRAEAGPWVEARCLYGELSIHASAGDIVVQDHHCGPIYLTADSRPVSGTEGRS